MRTHEANQEAENSVTGKITVFKPNEPEPSPRLHSGWGNAKRKMNSAGACKTEMARLYRRAAAGLLHPEDLRSAIWAIRQIAEVAEKEALEQKIDELETKLAGVLNDANR